MIEIPQNGEQLLTLVRRPEYGQPLRFVSAPGKGWGASLSLEPADMDKAVAALSALNLKLPRGAIKGIRKMMLRKGLVPELGSILYAYARVVRAMPGFKTDPKALEDVRDRLARYVNLRQKSGRAVHGAMDLRLVLGGLQWYMLRQVLQKVVARLESPDCSKAEAEQLQDRFSALLLNKEFFLQGKEQRQQDIEKQKTDLQAQTEEIRQRTQLADVKEAIRRKQPLDAQTLRAAAIYNRDMKAKQAEEAQAAAKKKPRKTRR